MSLPEELSPEEIEGIKQKITEIDACRSEITEKFIELQDICIKNKTTENETLANMVLYFDQETNCVKAKLTEMVSVEHSKSGDKAEEETEEERVLREEQIMIEADEKAYLAEMEKFNIRMASRASSGKNVSAPATPISSSQS